MKVSINLNDKVRIRPRSPHGYLAWQKYHEGLSLPVPPLSDKLDRQGFLVMQLHEVMTIFGPYIGGGFDSSPIETNFDVVEVF